MGPVAQALFTAEGRGCTELTLRAFELTPQRAFELTPSAFELTPQRAFELTPQRAFELTL
jgi:hypothetical protein